MRGVNVGGKAKVPMADLKKVFEAAGATKVKTYIQSGNVVFDGPASLNAKRIETAIEKHFHIKVSVAVRTRAQLKAIAAANPYDEVDLVHVAFLIGRPKLGHIETTDAMTGEAFTHIGNELYFYLPNGMGTSKLPAYVSRRVGKDMTARNWRTVMKLCEMLDSK
ncbi:MAG: hypothetical protein QOF21_1916 [Actinomycetota bacterium]